MLLVELATFRAAVKRDDLLCRHVLPSRDIHGAQLALLAPVPGRAPCYAHAFDEKVQRHRRLQFLRYQLSQKCLLHAANLTAKDAKNSGQFLLTFAMPTRACLRQFDPKVAFGPRELLELVR